MSAWVFLHYKDCTLSKSRNNSKMNTPLEIVVIEGIKKRTCRQKRTITDVKLMTCANQRNNKKSIWGEDIIHKKVEHSDKSCLGIA